MRYSFFGCSVIAVSFVLSAAIGCGSSSSHVSADAHTQGEEHHDHASEGPHHGHLIELGGEEFHLELTHDEQTKTVSVYVLDGHAKNAVPIAEPEIYLNLAVNGKPMQARLGAAPQQGDPAGQSSRFSATDARLLEALEAPRTTGRINLTIAAKPYSGAVDHHEHGAYAHR